MVHFLSFLKITNVLVPHERGAPRKRVAQLRQIGLRPALYNALHEDHVRPSVTQYQRLNRLSDVHEIRYRRYQHNAVLQLSVSCKSVQSMTYFT